MELIPLKTRRIVEDDDLASCLLEAEKLKLHSGGIMVISSKAVATAEGRIITLADLSPTPEAKKYAQQCGRSPEFCQAVLDETKKRHGKIMGHCSGALLTELKPWDLSEGTIFTANAGLDESNAEEGTAIGWPEDPVKSAQTLRKELEDHMRDKGNGKGKVTPIPYPFSPIPSLAVIISDSCCRPRRWGVTAYALTVAGLDPLLDQAGKEDLFGKKLRITKEAIADQLATAANMLMGNANQSVPAVIIRDHGFMLSDFAGWVPGIAPEEDLFKGLL